jgi:hypothetical protein
MLYVFARNLLVIALIVITGLKPVNGQSDQLPDHMSDLKKEVVIEKLSGPVNFDGIPDDEAWKPLHPIGYIMHSPVFGKDPSEMTDTRIGYNDDYLYFSSKMLYNDPEMAQSASLKRDYMGMGGDWFGVILDTYNDKENGLAFFVSPDGLRWDATVLKDAVTSNPDQMPFNISWNTFWDVKTTSDNTGWSLEMRIPFSSLRFQELDGEVRMGLIIQRWIPAKNETDLFPAIPPNWGQMSTMKPSQAQEVVIRGVKPDKPIYIAPYALGGFQNSFALNSQGTEYVKSGNPVLEAGLDVKYGITNNLTMDLTVNTDFAQVESDEEQVNLTRFSLYFPEKRTFFLERSSVFDFALGGNSNLFYSRRIGLSDDGDPVRIYGGARITGRVGKWDLGVLDMQTAPLSIVNGDGIAEELLPSENFGVLRFRRQILNDNTYIGAMMTSRLGVDGSYNVAYGLDGIFKLFGNDYLDIKWSQSFEDGIRNNNFSDPARIMARWERRSSKGLGYNLGYSQSGIHYNPGIGFEMMDDYASVRLGIKYGWMPGEKASLYLHYPELKVLYMTYIDNRSLMSLNYTLGWTFQTKNQWEGSLSFMYNREELRDSLELIEDELIIPDGSYEFVNFDGMITTPMTEKFFVVMTTKIGGYFDGSRFSVSLQPTWNASRHLELGATYNLDMLSFETRNQDLTNHILGIKASYMYDTRLSFSAYIQYNTAAKGVLTNLRFRYNPKEGNDFYIVFNEGRNTSLTREMPNLPTYENRSVLLKYVYTFSL